MKLALVGPAHPYKGGIAQHTTALAHRLSEAGHDVQIWSWKRQYPAKLYPGEQRVPGSVPEQPVFQPTTEPLSWNEPWGWVAAGVRARKLDGVVLTWTTPIQGPAYLGLLAGLHRHAPVVGMCHNVLPHEPRPGDPQLTRGVLRQCRGLLVHSEAQAAVAASVAPRSAVAVSPLPPPPLVAATREPGERRTLLFFGIVRPYKGLDLLLQAVARLEVPHDIRLVVAGEFWIPVEEVRSQVAALGLTDRVELRPGYVAASDLPALFGMADAVVLPYRSGTASIVTELAHDNGVPAIVTDVGTLAATTAHDRDGLVVPPEDVPALATAIGRLYDGVTLARLQSGVAPADADGLWGSYVKALEGLFTA